MTKTQPEGGLEVIEGIRCPLDKKDRTRLIKKEGRSRANSSLTSSYVRQSISLRFEISIPSVRVDELLRDVTPMHAIEGTGPPGSDEKRARSNIKELTIRNDLPGGAEKTRLSIRYYVHAKIDRNSKFGNDMSLQLTRVVSTIKRGNSSDGGRVVRGEGKSRAR